MCNAFEGMIDKAEDEYRVIVIAFCCDNDGGSQKGRKILVMVVWTTLLCTSGA
jgi:hypothetical protein